MGRNRTEGLWREAGRAAILLAVCIAAGFLLLCGAYLLPPGASETNALTSYYTLQGEGDYGVLLSMYPSTMQDNFTDSLMISKAVYQGDEPLLQKVAAAFHYGADVEQRHEDIAATLTHSGNKSSYARYWHGYLTVLRPLMMVLDIQTIRMLNLLVQLLLMAGLCWQMAKKGLSGLIFPLMMTYFFLSPITLAFSLQYSTMYYIAFGMNLLLLVFWQPLYKRNWDSTFFFLIGVLIAYYDFLTYPVAGLGIPAVIWTALLKQEDESIRLRQLLPRLIKMCVFWGAGYACMWISKWGIAALLLGGEEWGKAITSFQFRSSNVMSDGSTTTLLATIALNMERFFISKRMILLFVAPILVWLAAQALTHRIRLPKPQFLLCYALLACLPFGWYAVTVSHSAIHCFAYRSLCVWVFAMLVLPTLFFGESRRSLSTKSGV